jgi:asparagine synthase (glutamine-hydrolysing)
MTEAMSHRGPDDDGFFAGGAVGLAMRRLSIIDVEGGHQPISNEDDSIRLVMNGEIYNYKALRAGLAGEGHSFKTQTDTESVVHAYEQHGVGAFSKLRGMFAVAIWDEREQKLVLAIDSYGIKPLYYAADDNGIVFASELVALFAGGLARKELDHAALAEYFTLGYIPAPHTAFKGVRKLPPGTVLQWSPSGEVVVSPYGPANGEREAIEPAGDRIEERLLEHLRDSVEAHMVSDVPVGAFLSGGIDSSLIVALMSEASGDPVKTFSIGFEDPRHNELPLARLVAKRFATDHHEFVVEPDSVDVLPKMARHFGEPFADASALPTYYLSKIASDYVKVALSGDGGDEQFVGYTSFQGLEMARRAQRMPAPVRSTVSSLAGLAPALSPNAWRERSLAVSKRVSDSLLPPEEAYLKKVTMAGLPAVRPFLSPDFNAALSDEAAYATARGHLQELDAERFDHPLRKFVQIGFELSLPNDMLVKVDRMSMAHSLEVRVPMLDRYVSAFVKSLPLTTLFPRMRLKGLLRAAAARLLPEEIFKHKKHGFTVPITSWFRGDLAPFAKEVLLGDGAARRGFLDQAKIAQSLGSTVGDGGLVGSSAMWSLLMFELWCEEVLEAA